MGSAQQERLIIIKGRERRERLERVERKRKNNHCDDGDTFYHDCLLV
jgi:hypothetical protein